MRQALADTQETPVIDDAALQQGIAKATAIFQFQSPRATADLKQFAKKLGDDRELLRDTWSIPSSEVCLTVGALRRIIFPVQQLATNAVQAGFDIAASGGVRVLVAEQYRKTALDLNNEALIGNFGIGKIVESLVRPDSNLSDRYCYQPAKIADLKRRVLFVLGRIQFAIERYVELEDMRPWFAKNRVVDAVFNAFVAIGGFSVALANWAGRIINGIPDLIDPIARGIDLLVKVSIVGAGLWVYFNYIQEPHGGNR